MGNNWETDIYAKGRQINSWPYTELVAEVKRAFPGDQLRGKSVAELGCGTGNNLVFFAAEGCEISGIDGSRTALGHAERLISRFGATGTFFCADVAGELPWSDDSVDIVVDRGCLTQVRFSSIPRVLREVRRVLKPNGMFFSFTLYGEDNRDLMYGQEIEKCTYDNFSDGHLKAVGLTSVFSEDSLTRLLGDFRIQKLSRTLKEDLLRGAVVSSYAFVAVKG